MGLIQDSDFAGDLEDSKSTSGGPLCMFGSRTFVPMIWMCKKQTSASHSSTESEVVSLDKSLRKDGIPALDFWDLVEYYIIPWINPEHGRKHTLEDSGWRNVDFIRLDRPKADEMGAGRHQRYDLGNIHILKNMTASMKAAVHLGKDFEENLRVTSNTEFSKIRLWFSITQKLVLDQQDEIIGVSKIDWDQSPWMKISFVHAHAIKLSVLRLGGRIAECSLCETLDGQKEWFTLLSIVKNDGEPVVIDWKIFLGHTALKLLSEVQRHAGERTQCSARRFQGPNHLHVDVQ